MINSIPLSSPIEIINVIPFNPLISKCQIKVCWVGDEPNPNKSIITKATATDLAKSIPGSPIVGYYNQETGDFEGHNKIIEIVDGKLKLSAATQPYGFVDLSAKVWFQKFLDNGVEREYLVTEGWLWTGQFPECGRILNRGNNQSMELDKNLIDAHWTKDENGNNEFFIINEAIMSKLCILGENVKPAFEGANITAPKIEFSFDEDFKTKMFSMMDELKTIIKEGGINSMENNQPVLENAKQEELCPECGKPVTECECGEKKKDYAEEVCPKCGKPVSECECKEEPVDNACKKEYSLDEIPEYVELKTQFEALQQTNEQLVAENKTLTEFKLGVEKSQKEEMVKSFYMLDDEMKKEVVEHIDEYSLDEIEAKLSIICVRNKVSFEAQEKPEAKEEPIVYNLNTEETGTDDSTPAWVNSAIAVSKNM